MTTVRRGFVLCLLALSAMMLFPGDAEARRPMMRNRSLVSVSVVDPMGNSLRTFNHHGQTFVLGMMGQRYAVKIRNNTAQRVEVVMSVDGRDAVNGRGSNMMRDRGYVLSPMGSVTIAGFRTSMNRVAAFRFTNPMDSFAGRMGQSRMAQGIVKVAVFRERRMDAIVMDDHDRPMAGATRRPMRRQAAKTKRPGSATPSAERRRAGDRASGRSTSRRRPPMRPRDRANNLGTEFGEEMMSSARRVTFERDGRGIAQLVTVRYDNAEGLRARGIMRRPMMRRRHSMGRL